MKQGKNNSKVEGTITNENLISCNNLNIIKPKPQAADAKYPYLLINVSKPFQCHQVISRVTQAGIALDVIMNHWEILKKNTSISVK